MEEDVPMVPELHATKEQAKRKSALAAVPLLGFPGLGPPGHPPFLRASGRVRSIVPELGFELPCPNSLRRAVLVEWSTEGVLDVGFRYRAIFAAYRAVCTIQQQGVWDLKVHLQIQNSEKVETKV